MIRSVRNWSKRNRTNFAIGVGVLGAGYLVTQYALTKLTETRQRMSDERIAKEKYVNSTFSWNCANLCIKSAAPLRTEPRGLHLHCPCYSPYSYREYTRRPSGRAGTCGASAAKIRAVSKKRGTIRGVYRRSTIWTTKPTR